MASESPKVVIAAMVANVAIAITKVIAAIASGSSAMASEAIHSFVDTFDGGLLLLGLHLSRRPADDEHPFGHGKELYFWALVVSILVFGAGGGMSLYEGVEHLRHPRPLGDPTWSYVVLGVATVFEGATWALALKSIWARKGRRSVWQTILASKDPTNFTVLLEDSAALLGLLVAFLGIFLGHLLRNRYLDGAASVLIGCILALVAALLAHESKGLLVGESASPELVRGVRQLAEAEPAVRRVMRPLTMHFGPHDVLLNLAIEFRDGLSGAELTEAVERLDRAIRGRYPDVTRVFIEAKRLTGA